MAKYIFATKFKKIEKEPLYYNMQVSVDKDFVDDAPAPQIIYANSPIILFFNDSSSYIWEAKDMFFRIHKLDGVLKFAGETTVVNICDGDYPLPEIIQVDYRGTTFTFTPIPVYEPLYYNIQISVDEDCLASELGGVPPVRPGDEVVDFHFYKDSPIILSFISENYWGTGQYIGGLEIKKGGTFTRLVFEEVSFLPICEGPYPLPEIISVVHRDVTFTFTPIPFPISK